LNSSGCLYASNSSATWPARSSRTSTGPEVIFRRIAVWKQLHQTGRGESYRLLPPPIVNSASRCSEASFYGLRVTYLRRVIGDIIVRGKSSPVPEDA
jgi:hypothetical protein